MLARLRGGLRIDLCLRLLNLGVGIGVCARLCGRSHDRARGAAQQESRARVARTGDDRS